MIRAALAGTLWGFLPLILTVPALFIVFGITGAYRGLPTGVVLPVSIALAFLVPLAGAATVALPLAILLACLKRAGVGNPGVFACAFLTGPLLGLAALVAGTAVLNGELSFSPSAFGKLYSLAVVSGCCAGFGISHHLAKAPAPGAKP